MDPLSRRPVVLLAAGSSSRKGTEKQLLLPDGNPLVRRAAEAALNSDCSSVVLFVERWRRSVSGV